MYPDTYGGQADGVEFQIKYIAHIIVGRHT